MMSSSLCVVFSVNDSTKTVLQTCQFHCDSIYTRGQIYSLRSPVVRHQKIVEIEIDVEKNTQYCNFW